MLFQMYWNERVQNRKEQKKNDWFLGPMKNKINKYECQKITVMQK